ncbi:hypothetical protein CQW23_06138 [Capsicum baccatum]|uniref:Uncharacterized protein n=1 Tax=Capsicum baccatum TaxID=33114 RepID=A0A2G2X2F0_CAPBA|nr:hypothetical protein CQW23_06138 [Capsicum baccatum]
MQSGGTEVALKYVKKRWSFCQILENELKKQSEEFSENLEEELEKQAQEFEADLSMLNLDKVEQEQRAIRAEEAM